MAINNIKIVEVLLPGIRGSGGAVEFWSNTESNYEVNDKVSYLSGIFNAHTSPIPVGTLPTDVDYWTNITASGGGGGGLPLGGDVNDILIKQSSIDEDAIWQRAAVGKYNTGIVDYKVGDWVTDNSALYVCVLDNPPLGTPITDLTYWQDNTNKVLMEVPVTFWDSTASEYTTNDKVSYLDKLYNAKSVTIPVGTLPTDTNFWEVVGGGFSPVIDSPVEGELIVYNSDEEWVNKKLLDRFLLLNSQGATGNPRYDLSASQESFNKVTSRIAGGTYYLTTIAASLYEGEGDNSFGQKDHTYTEVGNVSVISTGNVNGTFLLEITAGGLSLSEGDAVFITNTPPDEGVEPEDGSDTYTVDSVLSDTAILLNKPILKGNSGYPDSSNFKLYSFTYVSGNVSDDDYVTFTGQGQVGYPFSKRVVQPQDKATASVVGSRVIWTFDRQQDRPNYYGLESDSVTKERPTGLWSKGATDNTIVAESYPYIFDGLRQNFSGIPNNRAVELQNYPVQNVFVATNQGDYDLTGYPNSYIIKNFPITNFNGSSYDLIILHGGIGTDPQFSQRPEFIPACKVCMDDTGVIQSVQDTVWVLDNGGYETKTSSAPEILSGLDVVDNGLVVPPLATQYTLTDSSIVTGYLDQVSTIYPDNISVTELWGDGDDRRKSTFTRDGRWYDANATIPDPQEPNAKHALIPFGEFGVDFLYVYEKSGSFYDHLVVKGDRLYNAFDLVQGVEIGSIRETVPTGYIPVAALVQLGSGDRGFHNVVDIKGKEAGSLISITTEEFLQDLSSKTQFRTEQNLLSKLQYNSSLQQGEPQGQGWLVKTSVNNVLAPVADPNDGSTTLEVSSNESTTNYISRVFLRTNSVDLYNNGGSDTFRVKPSQGITSGEHRMRIIALDDPRATETFFLFPEAYSQVPVVPYAVHDKSFPELTVTSTGEFSFKLERLNVQSVGTLVSGLNDKFSLRTLDGISLEFLVNGSPVGSGGSWNLSGLDVGKTVTIRRNGNQVQLLVEGVVRASSSSSNSDDWVVSTLGARDIDGGTTYTDKLHVGGFTDLRIKETSVSTPRIYQMETLLSEFEPDIPADGSFVIEDYAPYFWKARVSGDYPVWDETKADYAVGDIVRFTVGNYECTQANPPVGGFPSSQPAYWDNVSDIEDQTLYVRWGTNGSDTTVTLVTDAGNTTHTYVGETGYFDIQLQINQTSLNDWGTLNFTSIPPSGVENAQSNDNLVWNFSGFSDTVEISDLRTGNDIDGFSNPRSFYLKSHTLGIFRTPATILLTAEDMALNNIFVAEGNRDWVFIVPPYSTGINDLNSPNAASVTLKFIGEGSYLIKRPDLSDDVLVNNTESVQGVFTNTAFVDVTTEDDFTTLLYVNYTVSDITSGAGGLIPPSAPTEAINVSWDNSATDLTATNVQDLGTELALRGGTVDEIVKVTSSAGDAINFSVITIPTDYLTVPSLQLEFNGRTQEKGVDWVRNNSTSIRLPNYNTKATKHTIRLVSYPQ